MRTDQVMEIDDESLTWDETKKMLFQICMEGRWGEVVEIYAKDKRAHTAKITRGGDSALHLAVTDGQEDMVWLLVDLIVEEHNKEALRIQNKRNNTALHLAASVGTNNMVRVIADADPELVSFRNVDGETPLFLAAFHGRKKAFMILHRVFHKEPGTPVNYSNCRRNDGDTILHSTIAAENFGLAFQIIHLYGDLVNWVNERGETPLHVLATKPSAFKSGCRLGRLETFIYHGIHVKELKAETSCYRAQSERLDNSITARYPSNYQACMDCCTTLLRAAKYLIGKLSIKGHNKTQGEDLEAQASRTTFLGPEAEAWMLPSFFPANYKCCADFLKLVFVIMLVISGAGTSTLIETRQKKEKHIWSVQIMNELLKRASLYEYDDQDKRTGTPPDQNNQLGQMKIQDTPMIIAAKNGVTEMVEMILQMFRVAVHDLDAEGKNIVLLAIENRHIHLYQLLLKRKLVKTSLLGKVDYQGNSALHLAAKLGSPHYNHESRLNPVDALQMLWEIKWFMFIQNSMPPHFSCRNNAHNQTPGDVFTESHRMLVSKSGEWLQRTTGSCSLVATLIATVAFATSTTVPGGVRDGDGEDAGIPNLVDRTAYKIFSISALIALAGSINSVVLFLSILASRFHQYDFEKILPRKLMLGLITMFLSIISMLVSFCAAHFTSSKLRNTAVPIYALGCLPLTYFALSHFPLYLKLLWSTIHDQPQDKYHYAPL